MGKHVLVVQITWASDGSDTTSGWKLCLEGDTPSSTPSNAPSSSAGASHFSTTGPCTVEGACVSSPNYGEGSYDNNEACTIHPIASGTISVNSFETEQCCDHLIVGGNQYSGSSAPVGVSVEPSTEVCVVCLYVMLSPHSK